MPETANAFTLLQAVIVGIGGLTLNLTLIKLMIWRGNKETKDELKQFEVSNSNEHKKIFTRLDEHNLTIDRYTSNEAFYNAIERVAQDGVDIVIAPDEENGLNIGCYIQVVSSGIKDFAKDILIIGVNEASDEFISSKLASYTAKIRAKTEESFGKKNSIIFKKKYNTMLRNYSRDVKGISEDVCNDKNGRFRDMTIMFLRKSVSNIVRFGLSCDNKT